MYYSRVNEGQILNELLLFFPNLRRNFGCHWRSVALLDSYRANG